MASLRAAHAHVALITLSIFSAAAASAQGTFVAGWDFSQYIGPGALSTDCVTLATSLPANYSDFDPTFGAGFGSASFGTMYNDGTEGSTLTTGAFMPYIPTSGVIVLNEARPLNGVPAGDVAFNAFSVQNAEFPARCSPAQDVSMISTDAHSVVFEADLSSVSPADGQWVLTFGGRTEIGGSASVDIDFRVGAGGYTNVSTVLITSSETLFSVPLGSTAGADNVFVRLTFPTPGGPGESPIIDNVAIDLEAVTVPILGAPGLALLGSMLGVGGIAILRRRPGRSSIVRA